MITTQLNRFALGLTMFVALLSNPLAAHACPDIDGLADLNCDRKLVVVTFGDSITKGVGDSARLGYPGRLKLMFPNLTVVNLGDPGEKTVNGKSRASSKFRQYPNADYTIVLEGVNDYFQTGRTASGTKNNLLSMIRSASNLGSVALLGNLTSVKRSFQLPWVKAVNSQINPYHQVEFFSLGTSIIGGDQLHPNGSGYQAMALRAYDALTKASARNRPIDSDGDIVNDAEEIRYGTDPNNIDSDGDSIPDGVELYTYQSNPLSLDSDNDGLPDSLEVNSLHSNPADPKPGAPLLTGISAVASIP